KLIRFLEYMKIIKNDEYYSVGRCKLINYWLYYEVRQILASETRDIYNKTIRDLHEAWNYYNTNGSHIAEQYKCKPESVIPAMNDIEYNNKKNIHEHCLNYYEISKKTDNNDECHKYRIYIQGLNLPYTSFDSLFSEDKNNYQSYYNKCRTYNPINIPDGSTCPQVVVMDTPRSEEHPSLSAKGRQVELNVGTGGHTYMERAQQNLATDIEVRTIGVHSQMDKPKYDDRTPTEPHVSNPIVMSAGLSLLGIASVSTILYKVRKNLILHN
ncbi:CYIR protein, partial [Plasmodium cynomolgi strain B]